MTTRHSQPEDSVRQDTDPSLSQPAPLCDDERLVLPFAKRAFIQYSTSPDGSKTQHLFYDDKEIEFDEEDLFPFAEALATQSHFIAGDAKHWGPGYSWRTVQPLLDSLLDAGVLRRAQEYGEPEPRGRHVGTTNPFLAPATAEIAGDWNNCPLLTKTLAARELPLAWLELVIPVFRVIHIALDSENRQVGEANVFPPALRLDRPIEWRICNYPGSRYRDERPMNATALRSMGAQWPQMMALLPWVRDAFLHRYPSLRRGWTLGGIEALATMVLALPTYLMMRVDDRISNGDLHPALSSLFRVTDGVRMVTHQMIFVPVGEPTLPVSTPMTSRGVYEYAERNFSFSSAHGVCAGPQSMIEDLLQVLIDGRASPEAEGVTLLPELETARAAIESAMDYGLLGLQAHAAIFSVWPVMTGCYARLANIVSLSADGAADGLRERLAQHADVLRRETHHANAAMRAERLAAYVQIHDFCAEGMRGEPPTPSLAEAAVPDSAALDSASRHIIETGVRKILQGESQPVIDCLIETFLTLHGFVRVASAIQMRINRILGRQQSALPFDLTLIDIHNRLQAGGSARLPFLLDEIRDWFGIAVTITPEKIEALAAEK
ncbi:MAG: hypothetical protein H6994_19875 [Pseudomonadales bacterium]|nr:hypothetical protein [Pseudomonadales bacterium]